MHQLGETRWQAVWWRPWPRRLGESRWSSRSLTACWTRAGRQKHRKIHGKSENPREDLGKLSSKSRFWEENIFWIILNEWKPSCESYWMRTWASWMRFFDRAWSWDKKYFPGDIGGCTSQEMLDNPYIVLDHLIGIQPKIMGS